MNQTIKKRIEEINSGRVPEGYEKTSFGIFPCDWIKVSLGEVSAKKGEYGLNAPACEYEEGLPKYLRITDIDDQGRYIDNKACVNDADSHKYVLHKGDIVFARTGASVGKNYTYDEKDGILVYAGFLIKFSIKPQYNANLICSNCRTKKYNNWVAKMCARSGQPGINAEEYATYSFIIPKSAQEQSCIAEILMQWDKAIELQEKLIEAYQKSKKYYLNKMFPKKGSNVPEIRFPGFTAPWEQRKVTELGKIYIGLVTTMTKHYTNEGTLLIRNSDIKDSGFEFGDNPIYLENSFAQENKSRMHQIGDVITVHTGDVGTSAVITENEAKSIGFATIVTRPDPQIIDPNYLCTFLNTDKHKKWAVAISTGDGRTNYNLGDYYELVVPVPSIREQQKISAFIQNLNNLIALHQQKRDKLLKQRKAMQQYLLTGIVRV